MKNITSIVLISTIGLNIACTSMKNTENQQETIVDAALANNPFMKKSSFQYQAPEFDKIKDEHFDRFNFEMYGGVPVLGVAKPVIIGHGISHSTAFKNMIVTAQKMISSQLTEKIKMSFASLHKTT